MPTFSLECFQNEYLSPGASQVDAIVTVTARPTFGEQPAAATDGSRTEVIMIDVSGSMSGTAIKQASRAAAAAVDCIDDGVRFAIVAGNHAAWRLYPSAPGLKLAVSSPESRQEARAAVSAVRAGGGTAIGSWLSLATGLVMGESGISHAILLTDGRNESEEPEVFAAAIEAATGHFQCDCRGVGDAWSVSQIRDIATALLGSIDMVAEPEGLTADFTALMHQSMARGVGDVSLHLWTPAGATVNFVKEVSPTLVDLSDHVIVVNERVAEYPTGAWGDESRDYHVSIQVAPGATGDEMLAGRVTLMAGDDAEGQALVRAVWTEDTAQSTRINRQVAHYTGQADLADFVQGGLEALRAGDADEATAKLGRAVQLAQESQNDEVADKLAQVVDIDDAATGKVRLKKTVAVADTMGLDLASTKTARVRK